MQKTEQKGFTLIELLVVIAIIAILAVVLVLTLNPAELLRQARDSNRVSDLSTMKSALSLYLADVNTPFIGTSTNCYASIATTTEALCGFTTTTITTIVATTSQAINGNGWLPVNFNSISSGAPIGNLPLDPTNSGALYYRYAANSSALTYEFMAQLESTKYTTAVTGLEATDGGNSSTIYEVGTNLNY